MNWIQLTAEFSEAPEDFSPYIDVFVRNGCENTIQNDVPPTLGGCIVDVPGAIAVAETITRELLEMGVVRVLQAPFEEENWDEVWRRFFKPRRVGERFMIVPTWETAETGPDDLVILLDPGQAFGTGDHPTTRLCLELLERANVAGKRVADVGCGSGILSIGACLLGAASVSAVDVEPLSVEVAKENAGRNRVDFAAVVGDGIAALDPGPYDLVVSNIISAVLMRIAPDVAAELAEGGTWIVSGIIPANWPDVLETAERCGLALVEQLEEDGWIAATFRR